MKQIVLLACFRLSNIPGYYKSEYISIIMLVVFTKQKYKINIIEKWVGRDTVCISTLWDFHCSIKPKFYNRMKLMSECYCQLFNSLIVVYHGNYHVKMTFLSLLKTIMSLIIARAPIQLRLVPQFEFPAFNIYFKSYAVRY